MALNLRSTAPASAPIHAVTFFGTAYTTTPRNEHVGVTAWHAVEMIAPEDGPRLIEDKARGPYFVLCPLKVAPFVGKTAERFPGQSGKQRSASHVTEGSAFAVDLDGLTPAQLVHIGKSLVAAGVLFCAYSTHSHGKTPEEVRVRVLLFMDRALDPVRWADVWHVLNGMYFAGLADPATAKLAQQAGTWMAHPGREACSFRIAKRGALLSADALLSLVPPKPERPKYRELPAPAGDKVKRIASAMAQLDADDYRDWLAVLAACRGGVMLGHMSEAAGCALWWQFSETASMAKRANNTDERYDPAILWANFTPTAAPPEALVATLFAKARDKAADLIRRETALAGELSTAGLQAARYLAEHHRRAFDELRRVPT